MPHNTLHMFAPAKLNLFLHVTGKRADGYHTLQSLVCFVDVGDHLEISPHDSLYLEAEGPFAASLGGSPRDNLIYKAAVLLAEEYKVPLRGKITLTKNLPVSSGIGGGSSDAAAALKGLAKIWRLPEDTERLQRLALKLGADVPACFYKKTAWMEGIGEKITLLHDLPDLYFVLANPLVATPTAQVFGKFNGRFSPEIQFSGRRKTIEAWLADFKMYRNDLTAAALAVTPEIQNVMSALAGTTGCLLHRLSGSGATCFGIYSSAAMATAAANQLKEKYPEWWITEASILK